MMQGARRHMQLAFGATRLPWCCGAVGPGLRQEDERAPFAASGYNSGRPSHRPFRRPILLAKTRLALARGDLGTPLAAMPVSGGSGRWLCVKCARSGNDDIGGAMLRFKILPPVMTASLALAGCTHTGKTKITAETETKQVGSTEQSSTKTKVDAPGGDTTIVTNTFVGTVTRFEPG